MGRPPYAALPIEVLTSQSLSEGAKLLYAFLSYASGYPTQNNPTWYKARTLAKELGISQRSVERFKTELAQVGLIERHNQEGRTSLVWLSDLTAEVIENLRPGITVGERRIVKFTPIEGEEEAEECVKEKAHHRQIWRGSTAKSGLSPSLYMKHNSEPNGGPPSAGPQPEEEPNPILESMNRSSKAKRPIIRQKERRFDRSAEAHKSRTRKTKKTSWGPGRFLSHVEGRCQEHGVDLSDLMPDAKSPPVALRRHMGITINLYRGVGLDNDTIADMFEWLIAGWHDGLCERIGQGRPFSVFTLRYKAKDIIKAHGEIRSVPSAGPTGLTGKQAIDLLNELESMDNHEKED